MEIIRVLVAKPGLDGHDRGAKVVARGLRDQGFEVIYTGLHQTPEMVANAVIQEDVDVVGLSILSGAHIPLVQAIIKLLKSKGVKKSMFVGGIIPPDDAKQLKKMGVAHVFGPGTSINEIAEKIRGEVLGGSSASSRSGSGTSTRSGSSAPVMRVKSKKVKSSKKSSKSSKAAKTSKLKSKKK